jgi:hypothetical protein
MRARKQAPTIGIERICSGQELVLKFKGTTSQEEPKIGFSIFTSIESAVFGQDGIIWLIVSP